MVSKPEIRVGIFTSTDAICLALILFGVRPTQINLALYSRHFFSSPFLLKQTACAGEMAVTRSGSNYRIARELASSDSIPPAARFGTHGGGRMQL